MFHVQNAGQNHSPLKIYQGANIWKQHQHMGGAYMS